MKGRKLSTALLGALVGVILASSQGVFATHQPADKLFAAASKTVRFSPETNATLLTAKVKNSKPTDVILQVSMECSIITDNVNRGFDRPGSTGERCHRRYRSNLGRG